MDLPLNSKLLSVFFRLNKDVLTEIIQENGQLNDKFLRLRILNE